MWPNKKRGSLQESTTKRQRSTETAASPETGPDNLVTTINSSGSPIPDTNHIQEFDSNNSPIHTISNRGTTERNPPSSCVSAMSQGSNEGWTQLGEESQYSEETVKCSPYFNQVRLERLENERQQEIKEEIKQKELQEWSNIIKSQKPTDKTSSSYQTLKDNYRVIKNAYERANHEEKGKIIDNILNPSNIYNSSSGDDTHDEEESPGAKQAMEEESIEEKDTPDAVMVVNSRLNNIYATLQAATNKDDAKNVAKEHVQKTFQTFENALHNNDAIDDEDILSIIDESKIKTTCKSGSSECSNISMVTDMILQLPELKNKHGNRMLETGARSSNVDDIINAILSTNERKKEHIDSGEKTKLRDIGERNMPTDNQFENVWGTKLNAKNECCYLCGGKLVNELQVVPEMEHKLPSIEFYTKVHNINEEYPQLLEKWKTYINSDEIEAKPLYMYINCNGQTWYQNPERFLKAQFDNLLNPFITKNKNETDIYKFIALLKVYLMEFAYSHHLCNQIKDNDNLKNARIRDTYIKRIQACIANVQSGKTPGEPRVKINKVKQEKEYIKFDDYSNGIIGTHFQVINQLIGKYADLYDTSSKKTLLKLKIIMVQSIKATINSMIDKINVTKSKTKNKSDTQVANNRYIPMLDELDASKAATEKKSQQHGRQLILFEKNNPSYVDYDTKLLEYNDTLDELENAINNDSFDYLQYRLLQHRARKVSAKNGGKGTRKKQRTKKRGVKRCNKTQRHRKTKKK